MRVVRDLAQHLFTTTRLVEIEGGLWLHKRYRVPGLPRPLALRVARALVGHELANAAHLEGIPGVPARARRHDDSSLLREWIEGTDLVALRRRGERLPDAFFDELREILDAVHRRGIAFNDLERKDNVLLDDRGRPVLIDFQISTRSYAGASPLLRGLSQRMTRELQRQDVRYLYKMKRSYRADLIRPCEERLARQRSVGSMLYYPVWRVLHGLKRLAIPKGARSFRGGNR